MGVSITPESPAEATVLYDGGNRRHREAGYKRQDDTEVLITEDVIATWHGAGDPDIEVNPAGWVGLIEVVPQPRLGRSPRSELTPAVPIQDRINTTIFNRMVGADFGAFRQLWATGMKMRREVLKRDDGQESTRLIRPVDVGANRLLVNENPEGRFGVMPEATLRGFLDAVEQDVNQMAAITQTPPHYLLGQMTNLSADAIKAAEAGLVAKVRRRALHIGEAWEEVVRYALALVGSPAALDLGAEVIWADFETRSIAQLVDALVKLRGIGLPLEVVWERFGATPQEIGRWRDLKAAEDAAAAAAVLGGPEAAYNRLLTGPPGP